MLKGERTREPTLAEFCSRNPHGIHIDGLELTPLSASTPTLEAGDDFFSTWDKEKAAPKSPLPKLTASAPPSIGNGKPAARTVTSSSLRGTPTGTAHPTPASRLSSSTAPTPVGGKVSRLGAKKATTGIDFEAAQRKAIEEEEKVKRLGYDKQREEEEARAVKEREASERKVSGVSVSGSRTSTPVVNGYKEEVAPTRLGFGQTVGQAAAPVTKTFVEVFLFEYR